MSLVEAPHWIMWLHAARRQRAAGDRRKCYKNQMHEARSSDITKQLQAHLSLQDTGPKVGLLSQTQDT